MDLYDIEDTVAGLLDAPQGAGAVEAVVPIITTMAKAYVRGRGFTGNTPNDEIAAVITTAAVRLASNIGQVSQSQAAGPFTQDTRSYFQGWTLAEQYVLNRYRVRAM